MKETTYLDTGIPLFPNLVTLSVSTEFSRLPFLNVDNGKDHNFYDNSVLLAGKGIQGGVTLGGHHLFPRDNKRAESQLSGCHIDFSNGQVVKNGYYNTLDVASAVENKDIGLIRPENILRTLGDVFNVDYDLMRLISKDVRPLPKIIKS